MKIKFVTVFVTIFYFTSCDSAPKNPLNWCLGTENYDLAYPHGMVEENMTLEEPKMVKVFMHV